MLMSKHEKQIITEMRILSEINVFLNQNQMDMIMWWNMSVCRQCYTLPWGEHQSFRLCVYGLFYTQSYKEMISQQIVEKIYRM